MELTRRSDDYIDPGEVSGGGWLAAIDSWTAGVILLLVLLLLFAGLNTVGLVTLPGFADNTPIQNVPGNESEINGIKLAEVENAVITDLNAERRSQNVTTLNRTENDDIVATDYNRRRVNWLVGNGEAPQEQQVFDRFDYDCMRTPFIVAFVWNTSTNLSSYDNESAIGSAIFSDLLSQGEEEQISELMNGDHRRVGIDVHALADGRLFVTVVVC